MLVFEAILAVQLETGTLRCFLSTKNYNVHAMEFEINRVGFLSRETKIYCEEFEMMIVNAVFIRAGE